MNRFLMRTGQSTNFFGQHKKEAAIIARKKNQHDSTMYFMGKVVGKGTTADGTAFTELLNDCNCNPHEVLDRYMYFSPELRSALTKACEIFDKNNN